ncbi:fatty acyl-AMP ligase [Brasilonema sp. CT11]|nr:fatty acyl-AMP ligase [Brasilonema sp. CT11]
MNQVVAQAEWLDQLCTQDNSNSELTLVDLLRKRAIQQQSQVAYTFLVDGETQEVSLSYKELDQKARSLAALLQSMKATGERALLLYPPGLEFIAAFFGCVYAGVTAVPAYPPRRNQRMTRLQAIVKDAQASFALTTTSVLTNIEHSLKQEPELAALHYIATENLTNNFALDWEPLKISSDTLAFLQYTSGSTGTPKGVMVSHGNLLHNCALIHKCFGHQPHSLGVIWLPPYHDMGLIGGVLQPLYGGFPVILMSPENLLKKPLRWLAAISLYKGTTSGGPNFAYELCVNKITDEQRATLDLSSWQVAFNGAEPIRAETLERFVAAFAPCGFRREAFYPCYGMAETTLIVSGGHASVPPILQTVQKEALEQNRVVTALSEDSASQTMVGCGQPLQDMEVVIANPETMTCCKPNEIGEIWVSGASVTQGYWNRPEQTKQTFQAQLLDTQSGSFLRTGDLGFLQNGELFVTGRIKDVIIIRGQNHYPQDIELTVERSHPALRAGCGAVFTVEVKGEERLVVVQEVERSYLRKLNVNEVVGNIRHCVTRHHGLQIYAVVLIRTGTICKTSSNKIQRHASRAAFISGSLDVVQDWSENPESKREFLQLHSDVDSLLQELQETQARKTMPGN